MSLLLPDNLPAIDFLKEENIFVEDYSYALDGKSDRLRIVVLNLMPIKITTETDIARVLSNIPVDMEVSFMRMRTHKSKNTSAEYMDRFYHYFDEIVTKPVDAMIVTGAPVELIPFEEVDYWKELVGIFNWAHDNVASTIYICWAAQAALYHFHGINKYPLSMKRFGVFRQFPTDVSLPIFQGFDDYFYMPHSRHTEVRKSDIDNCDNIKVIAQTKDDDVSIVMSNDGREFYITGHMEYPLHTLDSEYKRDKGKRTDVNMPENYYFDDNPSNTPVMTWRAHANLFYNNWIKYYVMPGTRK